jgi:hypothetical protein
MEKRKNRKTKKNHDLRFEKERSKKKKFTFFDSKKKNWKKKNHALWFEKNKKLHVSIRKKKLYSLDLRNFFFLLRYFSGSASRKYEFVFTDDKRREIFSGSPNQKKKKKGKNRIRKKKREKVRYSPLRGALNTICAVLFFFPHTPFLVDS